MFNKNMAENGKPLNIYEPSVTYNDKEIKLMIIKPNNHIVDNHKNFFHVLITHL